MPTETPEPHVSDTIGIMTGLFASQLDIEPWQATVYNQKKDLGDFPGVYVDVEFVGQKPYGQAKNHEVDPDGQLVEVLGMQVQEIYTANIFSADQQALAFKYILPMCLNSDEAQSLQEKHSFKIAIIPNSVVDRSEVKGSARITRIAMTFNLSRAYERRRLVPSFADFSPAGIYLDPVPRIPGGNPIPFQPVK